MTEEYYCRLLHFAALWPAALCRVLPVPRNGRFLEKRYVLGIRDDAIQKKQCRFSCAVSVKTAAINQQKYCVYIDIEAAVLLIFSLFLDF